MNQQIKEIRTYQIAAISILRNLRGCRIEQVQSQYFDFLVTYEETSLVFGVEVKNSGFLRTNHFQDYMLALEGINVSERENRIPVLLAAVNEKDESVKIGFLLAWQFGKAKIFRKPAMVDLNASNADKILDYVKSMDETIRVLSEHGMKVVKRIRVEHEEANGCLSFGTVEYLRDFTQDYRMHQKEVVNERERMERLISGTPQNEYPDDELDRAIFEKIQERFPGSNKISDLMLFSTELRDLQLLSRSICRSFTFTVEPEIDIKNAPFVAEFMNGVDIVRFNVDVFIDKPMDVPVFENQAFEIVKPLNGWMNTYKWYTDAVKTLSSPRVFFMEGGE